MQREPAIGSDSLSPRERGIVLLGSQGLIDKEIAAELEIRVPTVRSYWVRIRNKTGVHCRSEATAIFARSEDEAAHLKSMHELREKIHALDGRLDSLAELLHSMIWVTDSEFRVLARYGTEPPASDWAEDIKVGAALADAFGRSGRLKAVADAHRRALDGDGASVILRSAGGEMKVPIGPLKDEGGLIVGCVGVMRFGAIGLRRVVSDRRKT